MSPELKTFGAFGGNGFQQHRAPYHGIQKNEKSVILK
jgi:hypothetical protein